MLCAIEGSPYADRLSIREENAGLHFLVRAELPLTDRELVAACADLGIRVRCLNDYYHGPVPAWAEKCLVINYSGLTEDALSRLEVILSGHK